MKLATLFALFGAAAAQVDYSNGKGPPEMPLLVVSQGYVWQLPKGGASRKQEG
ncbi:hypothetical protein [Pontibacter beigongshangensis]|uniref:hypothetical protein n=1 Tax=Pontibacter beigongshangensis TaxID=2574733 RepID=UPI001650088A|nr:hypothetical protein [Pontibacter beigongshangensis]